MPMTPHGQGVTSIDAEQLRAHMRTNRDSTLLIVDVREPQEYAQGHIPGALHIPLMDVEQHSEQLRAAPEAYKVFYCLAGSRSARAAGFVADELGLGNVFNLSGGLYAWHGQMVPDLPRMATFELPHLVRDIVERAVGLERGAEMFYSALREEFVDTPVATVLEELAAAEHAHERAVYGALRSISKGDLPDFDTFIQSVPCDILEHGAPVSELLERARGIADRGSIHLLDFAVELEMRAYDLYRNMAHRAQNAQVRETFLDLAQNEKRHARTLLRALGELAELETAPG